MKKNYILGSLWIVIAVFLTFLLVRGFEASSHSIKSLKKLGQWIEHEIEDEDFEEDWADSDEDWNSDEGKAQSISESNVFNVNEIKNINLEIYSLSLEIEKSNDSKIHLDFTDGAEKYCKYTLSSNTLLVKEKRRSNKTFYYHSKGKICFKLPESYYGNLDIEDVSGSVKINGIKVDSLSSDLVSGSLTINESKISELELNSVSGSIKAQGNFDKISCNSVSGSIKITNLNPLSKNSDFESISGSITLDLPENSNYTINYDSRSGSFTDTLSGNSGKKSGTSVKGNGEVDISITTTSGYIKVE